MLIFTKDKFFLFFLDTAHFVIVCDYNESLKSLHISLGISRRTEGLSAAQGGLCSMQVRHTHFNAGKWDNVWVPEAVCIID
jgi:hypothetical protein